MGESVDIVRRYNEAWLSQDLAVMPDFLRDDFILWHNHIGKEFSKPQMLAFIASSLTVIDRIEFRKLRRIECDSAVVQQHELFLKMKDGSVIADVPMPAK